MNNNTYNMEYKPSGLDREEYQRNLDRIQEEHLDNVHRNKRPWQPCLHDMCSECHGTGVKLNGSDCIHSLSCPCPKCSPFFC